MSSRTDILEMAMSKAITKELGLTIKPYGSMFEVLRGDTHIVYAHNVTLLFMYLRGYKDAQRVTGVGQTARKCCGGCKGKS